jgi:hypothetical protein
VLLRGGRRAFARRAVPLLWAAAGGTLSGLRALRTSSPATRPDAVPQVARRR